MARPWVLLVLLPLLTGAAALAGIALDAPPGLLVGVAMAAGAAVGALLAWAGHLRVERLAASTRRLDEVRRDFVMNASHELKTPVAGIQALSESLELALRRDPERAQGMIRRIHSESARLGALVRDLLDLARLEESASERGRSRVDVTEVARGQVERLAALARDRDVEVRFAAAEGVAINGVPEDVRLVVGNLVENGIRYNRAGGSVAVGVRRDGDRVVIEVADTGVGISEADQERIFERFFRVDKGRSRAAGGTGLGLSLVRHAVQRAGGAVELDSTPGEGSTFRAVLPVDPA